MSVKPILFSTPMVQAILDERKTMTRRVIKPQTVTHNTPGGMMFESLDDFMHRNKEDFELLVACAAPYQPGDILWVRETWNGMCLDCGECSGESLGYQYKADGRRPAGCAYEQSWRPSIFMPKEACRLFLRVTDVRVERLRDMPLFDVWAEGTPQMPGNTDPDGAVNHEDFKYLWDKINAKRGYGWGTNPWVWVYSFERVDKPNGWPGGEGK